MCVSVCVVACVAVRVTACFATCVVVCVAINVGEKPQKLEERVLWCVMQ